MTLTRLSGQNALDPGTLKAITRRENLFCLIKSYKFLARSEFCGSLKTSGSLRYGKAYGALAKGLGTGLAVI